MARRHEMMYEENTESLRIPADAHTFEGFWRWVESDEFPETGRIDFIAGEIYADMSPEDVGSHSVVKVAISTKLQVLVSEQDQGEVYSDRTRINHSTGLSVEPDVVVALWESFERGRLRRVTWRYVLEHRAV